MAYHKYKSALYYRLSFVLGALLLLAFSISYKNGYLILISAGSSIYVIYQLINFVTQRFMEMDSFFESVKYRDFTRWFAENSGSEDIDELHKGFNQVQNTIKTINNEKEAHFIIRQKILELINTGIIAYDISSSEILWMNDSFEQLLNIPTITNIQFINKRYPELYAALFDSNILDEKTMTLEVRNTRVKMLVSSSVFKVEDHRMKLIIIQNIDDALNRNESEAWKKLLSVMTHEIMNSIAPISSLAETLQAKVRLTMADVKNNPLEIEDLEAGIGSIKNRSEGLYKFAQIYRSLNNVTDLNLEKVHLKELFENIQNLMQSSLMDKGIQFNTSLENKFMEVDMDAYLIEQVLINLVLNAAEACKNKLDAEIKLSAHSDVAGNITIKVSDNGKGIPKDIIDDIFIPFFTTKKNGSGIGLSLSKQIMLLHKGKIQVLSKEKIGTAISLHFINQKVSLAAPISVDQAKNG